MSLWGLHAKPEDVSTQPRKLNLPKKIIEVIQIKVIVAIIVIIVGATATVYNNSNSKIVILRIGNRTLP